MTFDSVIFIISAVVAIFGATMMIVQKNPVASVLYLILSLVAQAACYVQLGALFLGIILIVVYAGAILVLFLFVVMLLNLRGDEDLGAQLGSVDRFTRYLFGILLTLEIALIIKATPMQAVATEVISGSTNEFGSVKAVARLMFTDFIYPFELTGILLLVAVVGAVVVAKSPNRDDDQPKAESLTSAKEGGE